MKRTLWLGLPLLLAIVLGVKAVASNPTQPPASGGGGGGTGTGTSSGSGSGTGTGSSTGSNSSQVASSGEVQSLGTLIKMSDATSDPTPSTAASPNPELIAGSPSPSRSPQATPTALLEADRYRRIVSKTVAMVQNETAQKLARSFGLSIMDLTWEDTGRYKGSSVGPNISDMTIQVQQKDLRTGQYNLSLMPVIRHPNFSDESADVKLDNFYVLVGNEKGKDLKRVTLRELLGNLRDYLHEPESWAGASTASPLWRGRPRSLLAPRDTHALVSAQAAFLPIPQAGKATFNPVLFNYQSVKGDPAVLTILATRQGTSVTVIDNSRDRFDAGNSWGQRLFFNKNGERASLTGERISDFKAGGGDGGANAQPQMVSDEGLNMVMLIQVPLKQKERPRREAQGLMLQEAVPMAAPAPVMKDSSNVEAAVISHGEVEGPFTEIDNLAIERDPRFPIRVTVQFYKATSNGVVAEADLREVHQQISRVYREGDYVGSLVVNGDTARPTEYDGPKQEPPGWWDDFWRRHEANTGQSREEALEMLRRLRGDNWQPRSPEELERALQPKP